jgi:precorrin-4/cobalt-precorrin-4 C11-methyltransferase
MTVHFIGAGPGAADLITLRGRDLIAPARSAFMPASWCPRRCWRIARPARGS